MTTSQRVAKACTDLSIAIAPFAGLPSRLRDLLLEGTEGGDFTRRLLALEEATARIESMLGRLCNELDNSSGTGSSKGKESSESVDAA